MSGILIIHQAALGDFIALFPATVKLKRTFSRVDAVCPHKLGKMAVALGLIDTFYPAESAVFASLYSDAVSQKLSLLFCSYDRIVLFSYSEKAEQSLKTLTRIPVYRIPPRGPVSQSAHITEHILSNLIACGLIESKDRLLSFPDLRNKKYDPKKILIHPGSGSRRKNWHISNFLKTESILRSEGFCTEWIIGPADESLKSDIRHDSSRKIHSVSDPKELAELLGNSGGFIGNDSGVSHLAAFIGIPTAAVFGPSDPARWAPAGRAAAVIRPADLECGPCFERGKNNCERPDCLNRTLPETVIRVFHSLCTQSAC